MYINPRNVKKLNKTSDAGTSLGTVYVSRKPTGQGLESTFKMQSLVYRIECAVMSQVVESKPPSGNSKRSMSPTLRSLSCCGQASAARARRYGAARTDYRDRQPPLLGEHCNCHVHGMRKSRTLARGLKKPRDVSDKPSYFRVRSS